MKTDTSATYKSQNQPAPRKSRILVVDDHPIVRQGLALLINQEADLVVCGEAEEASGAMHVLSSARPDVLIYECPRVSSVQKMGEGSFTAVLNGELTLHGVTLNRAISARVTLKGDTLRAAGEFSIQQRDYEIRPVSAAGGTVKLKDELKLSFDIAARRA